MKHYDLLKDGLFPVLDIPAPDRLESTEDYAQLLQHLISVYRLSLNLTYRQHGLDARTQLLTMMVLLTSGIMPVQRPEYVRDYPESLDDIYAMVGGFLAKDERAGKKAG